MSTERRKSMSESHKETIERSDLHPEVHKVNLRKTVCLYSTAELIKHRNMINKHLKEYDLDPKLDTTKAKANKALKEVIEYLAYDRVNVAIFKKFSAISIDEFLCFIGKPDNDEENDRFYNERR